MTHVTCLDMRETVVLVIIASFLPPGHGMKLGPVGWMTLYPCAC